MKVISESTYRNAKLIAARNGWGPMQWVYAPRLQSLADERGRVIDHLRGLTEDDLVGQFTSVERAKLLRGWP